MNNLLYFENTSEVNIKLLEIDPSIKSIINKYTRGYYIYDYTKITGFILISLDYGLIYTILHIYGTSNDICQRLLTEVMINANLNKIYRIRTYILCEQPKIMWFRQNLFSIKDIIYCGDNQGMCEMVRNMEVSPYVI